MAAEEFEIGDVVYLKSGSPPMTVEETTNNQITVAWFRKDCHGMIGSSELNWGDVYRGYSFNPKCLTKTPKE